METFHVDELEFNFYFIMCFDWMVKKKCWVDTFIADYKLNWKRLYHYAVREKEGKIDFLFFRLAKCAQIYE